jgi:hypothetical protein
MITIEGLRSTLISSFIDLSISIKSSRAAVIVQFINHMLQIQSKLFADHANILLRELNKCSPVIVLGTCIEENKLHKSFSQKMEVPVLKNCDIVEENRCCSACDELNFPQFASLTKDFLTLDLKNVAAKVVILNR